MVFTKVYNGDSLEVLPHIRNESNGREIVDLIVTSPPYNVGINYASGISKTDAKMDDSIPYKLYLDWMKTIWQECYNATKVGGRICVNIPVTKQVPVRANIMVDHGRILQDIGWKYRDTVIWYKQNIGKRTAWGSYKSPSNPWMVNPYECILIYHKMKPKHKPSDYKVDADITADEFKEWTNSFWKMQAETSLSKKHPAPFPQELPRRLIKFYSFPKDIVMDPFLGAGTTCMVAKELGRNSIGIELDEGYTDLALKRITGVDFEEANRPPSIDLEFARLYEVGSP